MRVRLRPGLPVLWRAPGALQIGLIDPHRVVLEGLTADQERLISAANSNGNGVAITDDEDLLPKLARLGMLVPARASGAAGIGGTTRVRLAADALAYSLRNAEADGWAVVRGRAAASVAVVGLGRTGAMIAAGLATAGVGRVLLQDESPVLAQDVAPGAYRLRDVGVMRQRAAAQLLHDLAPETSTAVTDARPDIVVLVEAAIANPVCARSLMRDDVTHLSVLISDGAATVGPFVIPGQGPCLQCLDLHRTDADPQWPVVATQVAGSQWAAQRGEEVAIAACAASLATAQVLTAVDGALPLTVGATLELQLPQCVAAHRQWPVHPECGCDRP